jgi:hypothetical protein
MHKEDAEVEHDDEGDDDALPAARARPIKEHGGIKAAAASSVHGLSLLGVAWLAVLGRARTAGKIAVGAGPTSRTCKSRISMSSIAPDRLPGL